MTRAMLLPIPVSTARRRSIEHHMACRLLASGNGTELVVAQLFNAIYGAYFVHLATEGRSGVDVYRDAELALGEYAVRAKAQGRFDGAPDNMAAIQNVLLLRDQQFQKVPSHIIDAAQQRLLDHLRKPGDDSPIARESDSSS